MMRESCIYMCVYVYMSKKMIRFQDLTPDYISRSSLRFFLLPEWLSLLSIASLNREKQQVVWKTVISVSSWRTGLQNEVILRPLSNAFSFPKCGKYSPEITGKSLSRNYWKVTIQKLLESFYPEITGKSLSRNYWKVTLYPEERTVNREYPFQLLPLFSRYVVSTFFCQIANWFASKLRFILF